ncbi:carboxylesterase family protein [Rothia sp. ZJ932]|uniref:carboxylesterase family protein n=1 Tax=Rothia sp. ZJ932 TaxID=2810516 RepID=UPI001967FC36|nr:carboxylesterase family protein [Rothia sp. ZJ932]QRZ62446.1 carboxylesterase family protein [Rothia sp. ZJ932]
MFFTISAGTTTIHPHRRGSVLEVLGIPYARAQRFEYPQPVAFESLESTFDPSQPAPAAPQYVRGGGQPDIRQSVLISEDCQNLSVIMPDDLNPGEQLPVMVYFHGGSYVVGSGDGARYNPDKLINEHRVIMVRVTYRLGILGFLGGTPERPANLGLLDAREALRWIKKNISLFGGDPDNITAFGQSAGGDLVSRLLIAEGVIDEELIHRAIIQSAPIDLIIGKEKMAGAMLTAVSQKLPVDAPHEEYGALAYKMQVQNPFRFGLERSMMAFGTQLGHYPLPAAHDLDAAYEKVAARVRVLIGSNERESAYFLPRKVPRWAFVVTEPVIRNFSWRMYAVAAQRFVRRHRESGGEATRYYLRTGFPSHRMASVHCAELGLLFDNPSWKGSDLFGGLYPCEREDQARALRNIWATFAKTGKVRTDLAQQGRLEFS